MTSCRPAFTPAGLRYHGDSPLVSQLYHDKLIEAQAYHQTAVFDAAMQFANTEAIIPAPESAHAIRAAINEALRAKEEGKEKTILFNLSGHGYLDLQAYADYREGKLYGPRTSGRGHQKVPGQTSDHRIITRIASN